MNEEQGQQQATVEPTATNEPAQAVEPTTIAGNAGMPSEAPQTEPQQQAQAAEPVVYDLKGSIPEGWEFDQAANDAFLGVIRDMGLSNEQANAISAYGYQWAQGIMDRVAEAQTKQVATWAEETKTALGGEFDNTVALCGTAVNHLEKSNPGLRAALNETGAGNRIEVVRAFAELGKLLQSDPGKLAGAGDAKASATSSRYPNTDFSRYK